MKKTFTINISGKVFHIEENAYEVLKRYMINIKEHFCNTEDGDEIVSDIEYRLSELFTEKEENNVITLEKVDYVIEIMGEPNDFEDEEENNSPKKLRKRIISIAIIV